MNGVLNLQLHLLRIKSGKCVCPGNNMTFSRSVFAAIFLESFLALWMEVFTLIHTMIVSIFCTDIHCPQRLTPHVSLLRVFRAPLLQFKVKYLNNCLSVGHEIWHRSPQEESC